MLLSVDFKLKSVNIDDKLVRLQIWDTAGQERFQTITCNYYQGAHGILIVYDVTDPSSFESLKNWHSEIKKYANSDVELLIIGNKCDLEDKRAISYEEGKKYADDLNIPFFETSAKDTINVTEAFQKLASIILKKHNFQKEQKDKITLVKKDKTKVTTCCK